MRTGYRDEWSLSRQCEAPTDLDRHHRAGAERQAGHHRWAVRGDQRAAGRRDRGAARGADIRAMNLGELHRREYGRILASLIRVVRDFDLAEDALQEAFEAALAQWPAQGPPQHPVAWLLATARHKAIDQLRRRALAERTRDEIAALVAPEEDTPVPLDALRLIFTCCHPSLPPEAQMALTLRTICGLTTEEIARAFLVPVPTLAQRLVRAKAKIKSARIPYEVPADDVLAERLDAVMTVVYLVFNEGYSASFGADLVRAELCADA